jgi:predicted nuclease of predicted toxin-antitoxin system
MTIRFLVDAQLPPALARYLTDAGYQAEHVYDIGMAEASDRVIWSYATQNNATIITKDEDFVTLSNISSHAPPVVWVRVGNIGKQALLRWMVPMLTRIVSEIKSGEKLIEIAQIKSADKY